MRDTPETGRRGLGKALIVIAALAVGAAGAGWYATSRTGGPTAVPRTRATGTVRVERRDLVVTTSQEGTLGYGTSFTIIEGGGSTSSSTAPGSGAAGTSPTAAAQAGQQTGADPTPATTETTETTATTAAPRTTGGTLTAVAPGGALLERGASIYSVDEEPRVLLYGNLPAWRELSTSTSSGDDVAQLEVNLRALGHDPDHLMVVDGTFDWATSIATARWQASIGLAETGSVALGQVVFLPGPARVGTPTVEIGGTVRTGTSVVDLTPIATVATTVAADGTPQDRSTSRRVVTTTIAVSDRGRMQVGDKARIELTDGTETSATVAAVGAVATRPASGRGNATVEVTLTLDADETSSDLVAAPVTILLPNQSERGALVVPTSALVALKEGGFAIELVAPDATTRLVGVKTGLYADSLVAITGDGVEEGSTVVVAK